MVDLFILGTHGLEYLVKSQDGQEQIHRSYLFINCTIKMFKIIMLGFPPPCSSTRNDYANFRLPTKGKQEITVHIPFTKFSA